MARSIPIGAMLSGGNSHSHAVPQTSPNGRTLHYSDSTFASNRSNFSGSMARVKTGLILPGRR